VYGILMGWGRLGQMSKPVDFGEVKRLGILALDESGCNTYPS